jgi:hypothetical protein
MSFSFLLVGISIFFFSVFAVLLHLLRLEVRKSKNEMAEAAALLRCKLQDQTQARRGLFRLAAKNWAIRGRFRHRTFEICVLDRRHGGIGNGYRVLRYIAPSLAGQRDLFFDMRPRSLSLFLGQFLGLPLIPFSDDLLDKWLAFRCNDGALAKDLRGFDEYRRVLVEFWCLSRYSGTLRFSKGNLTYVSGRMRHEELRPILELLCDLSDLIRSRSWSYSGAIFQEHGKSSAENNKPYGDDAEPGEATGETESKGCDFFGKKHR